MDRLKIKKILIVGKNPSPFKNGYWDVDIKFVFEYRLTFREADASVISPPIKANNIYNMKACLFGSVGSGLVIGTDLLRAFGDSATFDAEPFVLVEAKAVSLNAQIHSHRRHRDDCEGGSSSSEVRTTIGLFSIVKLFRLVNLTVESRGFDIPDECAPLPSPVNPCAYFEELDFPMDIFAPPQKPEFTAGVSLNIPRAQG